MYTWYGCFACLYYECTQVPEQILLIAKKKKIACGDILVLWGPHSFSDSFELQIFAISELDDLSHWQKTNGSLHLEMPFSVFDLLPL